MRLHVRHRTTYIYSQPVSLGAHRLMLRPRESPALQLLSFSVATTPLSLFSWTQDVYGNAIVQAMPLWSSDTLVIDSELDVEIPDDPQPRIMLAPAAREHPFRYTDTEWNDLGALVTPQYADPQGELRRWAQGFIAGHPTNTLALLRDINAAILNWVFYESRQAPGTQAPLETLKRGWGSCRDLAVLMADAVRWLGFGARLVSGYVYVPGLDHGNTSAAAPVQGSTHAWVEVYLPGAGWIAFDPTHRSYGDANLVPVAVARGIAQLPPVEGSFIGTQTDYIGMSVGVSVSRGAMRQDAVLLGQAGE